ncbi:hypothetical protein ACVIM9_008223 [Bradyrhizobium sp. USDA 4520]
MTTDHALYKTVFSRETPSLTAITEFEKRLTMLRSVQQGSKHHQHRDFVLAFAPPPRGRSQAISTIGLGSFRALLAV